jgi:beta-galactosidase
MNPLWAVCMFALLAVVLMVPAAGQDQPAVTLPDGVKAVWDPAKAYRETTPSRERLCINGLWRWQPVAEAGDAVPTGNWGYFKVPGPWPGITDYMQNDYQTPYTHPAWRDTRLDGVKVAWYQREITVPASWAGRRISVQAEYVNSFATFYLDGQKAGEIRFPAGEVDLTALVRPGQTQMLSVAVVAMPLKGVQLSFNDTNSAKQVQGSVARRGLCGDVFLASTATGGRLGAVRVETSTRKGEITFRAGVEALGAQDGFSLQATIREAGREVASFQSPALRGADLQEGQATFTARWKPEKLWDIHTPQNQYEATVSLLDGAGNVVDTGYPVRFGFREFWIDGRDFYLNGTRLYLSSLPLDNAQVGAALSTYEAAKESMRRFKSIGINMVYTHNYGCEPGTHLSFGQILRAADDVGMLVSLSQPHFGQYNWDSADADKSNGYARDAAFYVGVAGSHPSVVFYSMSHNATGYGADMNPDMIDGLSRPGESWAQRNAQRAVRAEAIVHAMDPTRIVYHHSSGNLSSMHTSNFYTNFAPSQELDEWFGHWATVGVKPMFTCEYMVPCTWDWTMYRGYYKGAREFGSAVVPWEFCIAEWSSQFMGDRAYQITEPQRVNLRWEARQFREGKLWHRWDYPYQVGDDIFDEQHEIIGQYLTDNWRAYRTWGLSANSPWEHGFFWRLRPGADTSRKELPVDWDNLQRPGYSPDYIERTYGRMDLAYRTEDWEATADGQAILRNNRPLLAYIAGKAAAFTSKDHNFVPGETVDKQLIVINNSRETVTCDCRWTLGLAQAVSGTKTVTVPTGQQERIPLSLALPATVPPGAYELSASVAFSTGETQTDSFTVHVVPRPTAPQVTTKVALFDPAGETGRLLNALGVAYAPVKAGDDLSGYGLLVVGKGAMTVDGDAPDISRVREGLKVVLFEQTSAVLEKRFGFRVQEYGLRQVFARVPDHPLLAGIGADSLQDWRGEATILPPRLKSGSTSGAAPVIKWCGIDVPHVWRCGNRGNVASVLIEKPARGDFLPILDGGYSLQYCPLLEYREGRGMVLFFQVDVTGRTESDPVAETLAGNVLRYASAWKPAATRTAVYLGGPAGRRHLEHAGVNATPYEGGALSPDQVLIVAAGANVSAYASEIRSFVQGGGRVLALGLDEAEANAFLPARVGMQRAEHIAAYFEPPRSDSLFAGVAPADVHNRDPRQIPLLTAGATVLGDGVLAQASGANVVFFQLPPYDVTRSQGAVPSFVVDGKDASEGKQSALLTLGAINGTGAQFGQQVAGGEPGKTYTFVVSARSVGEPVAAHLEIERPARPWDRALKAPDVTVPADAWTEMHATFAVDKPFAEGWYAYVACATEGGVLRLDNFRLYEGQYVPGGMPEGARNVFSNPGFEEGTAPYRFPYHEQHNLRRTYRRTSFTLSRLLANMGVQAQTPLLERFVTPTTGVPKASVVKNGEFMPQEGKTGAPAPWTFSAGVPGATCDVDEDPGGGIARALRMTCPQPEGNRNASVMLAQADVAVEQGQWYRISFATKGEKLAGSTVTLALQNTTNWTSLFDYQRFTPGDTWDEVSFVVQAKATAIDKTRFQIWHDQPGTLWLANLRMQPCDPPTQGRWLTGLYVDQPAEWDDPYRFFRW